MTYDQGINFCQPVSYENRKNNSSERQYFQNKSSTLSLQPYKVEENFLTSQAGNVDEIPAVSMDGENARDGAAAFLIDLDVYLFYTKIEIREFVEGH
jgi:hypothetical protein